MPAEEWAELVGNFFPQGNQSDGHVTACNSAGVAEEVFGNVFVSLQC